MGKTKLWAGVAVFMLVLGLAAFVSRLSGHAQRSASQAQQTQSPARPEATSEANPNDVRSIDSIIHSLYTVISGPAGQKRDWNRLRSLFVPGARLVTIGHNNKNEVITQNFSLEEYITRATPFFEKTGFYEHEIKRHTDRYAHIAQVFSTYESQHDPDEKPFQRGINGIQLVNDGHRWWVVTIFWENEVAGRPLPKRYLPKTSSAGN